MTHQNLYRDAVGKLQWMDCPCGDDHGMSVNEERLLFIDRAAELEGQLRQARAERDTARRQLRLALRRLAFLRPAPRRATRDHVKAAA